MLHCTGGAGERAACWEGHTVATGTDKRAASPTRALTHDFLTWIAAGPRTYADVMDTWQTSCPRLSIWEDALDDGLVQAVRSADAPGEIVVVLTPRGRAMLDAARIER